MADAQETVTFYWVKCDDCGAPSNLDTEEETSTTREDAREEAAMMGWREITTSGPRRADICDDCKEKPALTCGLCGQLRGLTEDSGYIWCACNADLTSRPSAFTPNGVLAFANTVALAIGAAPGNITFRGDGSFKTTSIDRKITADVTRSEVGLPETSSVWDVYLFGEVHRTVFTYVHDGVPTPQDLRAMMRTDPVAALILDRAQHWQKADCRYRVGRTGAWPLIIRLAAIIGASPNSAAPTDVDAATILTSRDGEVTATATLLPSTRSTPVTAPPMWVITLRAPSCPSAVADLVLPGADILGRPELEAAIRGADGMSPILDRKPTCP